MLSNPAAPARIRGVLNGESGLNDGIVTPVVMLALVKTQAIAVCRKLGVGSRSDAVERARALGML